MNRRRKKGIHADENGLGKRTGAETSLVWLSQVAEQVTVLQAHVDVS